MRAIKLSKLKELLDIHTRVYTNVPKEYLEIFDNFNMNLFLHLGNDIAIKSLGNNKIWSMLSIHTPLSIILISVRLSIMNYNTHKCKNVQLLQKSCMLLKVKRSIDKDIFHKHSTTCKILCISILIYTTILKRWFKKEEVFCLSLSGTSIQYTQETNLLSICNTTRTSWESWA